MKKVSLILLALLLVLSSFCLVGCQSKYDRKGAPDPASYKAPEINEDNVTILFAKSNRGDNKTSRGFSCDVYMDFVAKSIRKILAELQPTGEMVPALSNTFEMPGYDATCEMPAPAGINWIEVDNMIYRVERGRICVVNKHFGAGIVLGNSEDAWDKIFAIRARRQGDYWEGDYIDGVLTAENTAEERGTTISLRVKDACAQQVRGGEGKVVVEITSSVDQTLWLSWETYLSDDNLGSYNKEMITLGAGETKELELNFIEVWDQYYFKLEVGGVIMVRIYFHPPKKN